MNAKRLIEYRSQVIYKLMLSCRLRYGARRECRVKGIARAVTYAKRSAVDWLLSVREALMACGIEIKRKRGIDHDDRRRADL